MKIKIFSFEIEDSEGYTLEDFFQGFDGETIFDTDHIVGVKQLGHYWAGILLSIKDQKAFCRIKRHKSQFTLAPEKLGDDRIADFNYFIINPKTNRGLYQWYHQSGSVSSFCSFLKVFYNSLRDKTRDICLEKIEEEKDKTQEKKRFRKSLHLTILCRADSLEKRIKSLESVQNLEVAYATYDPVEGDPLAPFQPYVKRRAERVSFKKGATGVVAKVAAFARQFTGETLRVEGVDPDGHEQIYKLMNDHDVFEEFEYDDVLESISLDSANLAAGLQESELVKRMLGIAEGKAKRLLSQARAK